MKRFLACIAAFSLAASMGSAVMAEDAVSAEDTAVVEAGTVEATDAAEEEKKEEEKEDKTEEEKKEEEKTEEEKAEEETTGENKEEEKKDEVIAPAPEKKELSVQVNGADIVFPDAKPFIDENSRTLIPLRAIGEALSLEVEWNKEDRTATFIGGDQKVIFTIDQEEYEIVKGEESEKAQMDTKAIISEDRTYAPVRYLAEAFGCVVGWDNDTKTVKIDTAVTEPVEDPVDDPVENPDENPDVKPDENPVAIDYGKSEIYTEAEMNEAIAIIIEKFSAWEGCEMHSITYAGDEANSPDNIKWMNEHGDGHDYDECIEFTSNFHSPKEAYGAWEADMEYENWQWWLARTTGGEWEFVDSGY